MEQYTKEEQQAQKRKEKIMMKMTQQVPTTFSDLL
jgi:hypothetical protein